MATDAFTTRSFWSHLEPDGNLNLQKYLKVRCGNLTHLMLMKSQSNTLSQVFVDQKKYSKKSTFYVLILVERIFDDVPIQIIR